MSYFDPASSDLPSAIPNKIVFPGEMPLPEAVGDSDVGISGLKANADHAHLLELGGKTNPWINILLSVGATWFGGVTRIPQYTRIGTVGFMRGVIAFAPVINPPFIIGTIPIDFCAQNGISETFPILTQGPVGPGQVDLQANGNLVYTIGPANIATIVLGNLHWSID